MGGGWFALSRHQGPCVAAGSRQQAAGSRQQAAKADQVQWGIMHTWGSGGVGGMAGP